MKFLSSLLSPSKFQSLLHRPLSPGMVGLGKELIRNNLLRNPIGLINLLGEDSLHCIFVTFLFILSSCSWRLDESKVTLLFQGRQHFSAHLGLNNRKTKMMGQRKNRLKKMKV